MGVRARSGGPQPKDPSWLAEQHRLDADTKREVQRADAITKHLGNREVERRAAEAGRLYAQKLFLHEHREAIRLLKNKDR